MAKAAVRLAMDNEVGMQSQSGVDFQTGGRTRRYSAVSTISERTEPESDKGSKGYQGLGRGISV